MTPVGFRFDSTTINATRLKLKSSLYVPGVRFWPVFGVGPEWRSSCSHESTTVMICSFKRTRAIFLAVLGEASKSWRYGQALRALREIVEESGRELQAYALHSLRIGSAFMLAA